MDLKLHVKLLIFSLFFICSMVFSAKKEIPLNERVQQLIDASSKKPLIKLNGEKFRQYVEAVPRNYSVIVMFTALAPQRQCEICGHANEQFQLVANSWRYSQSFSNKVFFAVVDFDEASDVFQKLHLTSAPVFKHFPAKGKPKKADDMDIQRTGFDAENIVKWVSERTEMPLIRVFRPPNYTGLLALIVLLSLVVGLLYLRKNNLEFFYNSTMWGLAALAFTFAMTSGQMWNHIRGPPFLQKTQAGALAYIHGSSQGQFIAETYIVATLYAATVLGIILMVDAGNKKDDLKKRKFKAIIGLALYTFFFSLQLSVFRLKAQGYPYSFLLK